MLRLTDEQLDQAAECVAKAIARAEEEGFKTNLGRAFMIVGALSEDFDIEAIDPGPDAAIEAIWENAYNEVEAANALFDWSQGRRP